MNLEDLGRELRNYCRQHSYFELGRGTYRPPVFDRLDAYAAAHPDLDALQLKAAQYEILAEEFDPVLFHHSPFYGEMGMKVAEYDGQPFLSAGGWLFRRRQERLHAVDPGAADQYTAAGRHGLHLAYGMGVDYDHHCFPYTHVLEQGLSEIHDQAVREMANGGTPEEQTFLECARRGLQAVKRIAEKFADSAERRLSEAADEGERANLRAIAQTARRVPWGRPETFYEGLCAVWFLHEVCATIEGIGMSVIGHLDRLLGGLYQADLAAGRLTRVTARDLLGRFLLHTDCKVTQDRNVEDSFNRQEQGDTLILGGCDETGAPVCNELTYLILETHRELGLIYPKLHCRISRHSPQELLDAVNRDFLRGRSVCSFLNDEGLIPAQVKAGKRPADARRYVAGGCWETIVEGFEHSAGANCYLNLARVMDRSIHEQPDVEHDLGLSFSKLDGAESFEQVYQTVMDNILRVIRKMCAVIGKNGSAWSQVNPAPFFSACLGDCLENRRDYTAGGGRYNPHGLPLANFAILIDSLLSIREICFAASPEPLSVLLQAVRADWQGYDTLRRRAMAAPHFGDDRPESKTLAARILKDIYIRTRDLKNERGGPFQLGIYSYRDVIDWRDKTLATPNGRCKGDFLTQGLAPSRLHHSLAITEIINSAAALDLSQCPANSVLTISLPLGNVSLQILAQLERSFAASGIGMLQINCVNREQLLDARLHPERHRDLIVRLYGYSARFINLTPDMQEEFISRTLFETA